MKRPCSYWHFIWIVQQALKRGECERGQHYWFPLHVARILGCTQLEAELGLRMLVEHEQAGRRNDGRFYLLPQTKKSEAV